jgi:hypothetical protein
MTGTQRTFLLLALPALMVSQPMAAEEGAVVPSGYDARIRNEAHLPDGWFSCKTVDDCVLVKVPCSLSIAVNVRHKAEAQRAIDKSPRSQLCLGNALDVSLAACEAGQCVTKQKPFP